MTSWIMFQNDFPGPIPMLSAVPGTQNMYKETKTKGLDPTLRAATWLISSEGLSKLYEVD